MTITPNYDYIIDSINGKIAPLKPNSNAKMVQADNLMVNVRWWIWLPQPTQYEISSCYICH